MTPRVLTRPYVGFNPTMLQQAAGQRMDPPVSDPSAPKHSSAETAAADPPEEPPAMWFTSQGLCTAPKWLTTDVAP